MKRPKIHLIDVSEPILVFSQLKMRCGAVLENARFKWAFDVSEQPGKALPYFYMPGVCNVCRLLEPVGEEARTYLYGMVEARSSEKEAEAEEWEAVS